MKVVLQPDAASLDASAPAWMALEEIGDSPPVGPFQRLAWARAWMATFGRDAQPWILAFGEPVTALLPLVLMRRRGLRIVRFLGHGVSDYLGTVPLAAPADAYHAFGSALRDEAKRFDLLDLQSWYASHEQRQALLDGLGARFAERIYERCPVIDTTGDWPAYLASRKKKFRANLKRAERRVTDQGEPLAAREEITPALFDELVRVERESWKWAAGTAFLRDERSRDFLAAVLLHDPIPHEIWTLRVDGELAGFGIVFLGGDVRSYYLPSFRERFPDSGTFLLAAIVRDTLESAFREFDFLRGDEAYKLAWAHRERVVHEVVSPGRTVLGPVALAAVRARWRLARSERVRRLREKILRLRTASRPE